MRIMAHQKCVILQGMQTDLLREVKNHIIQRWHLMDKEKANTYKNTQFS